MEKQLEIEKGRFTSRDAEMNRLKDMEVENGKRITQLEKMLENEKARLAKKEEDLTSKE